jgi:phage-related protein
MLYSNKDTMLNIYFYQKISGRIPVKEFLESLPKQDEARISYDLLLLKNKGLKVCGLSLRHISGKLWEIKFKLSSGYRIFYCMVEENLYLLHAYKKQSQKAPGKEITIALKRMKELLS